MAGVLCLTTDILGLLSSLLFLVYSDPLVVGVLALAFIVGYCFVGRVLYRISVLLIVIALGNLATDSSAGGLLRALPMTRLLRHMANLTH